MEDPHTPFINGGKTLSANYEAPDVMALDGGRRAAGRGPAALVLPSSAEASGTPLCQPRSSADSAAGQPVLRGPGERASRASTEIGGPCRAAERALAQ